MERFASTLFSAQRRSNSSADTIGTGMQDLLPIERVTVAQIEDTVTQALREGADADVLADFLASVDWSGIGESSLDVVTLLGELENWTTLVAEGNLSPHDYESRLRAIPGVRNKN